MALVVLAGVGLTAGNAAAPDLGARGWAPGHLLPAIGPATTAVVLAAAYLLGTLGIAVLVRSRWSLPQGSRFAAPVLAVAALLTAPFGSADHVNYAAYGRILLGGGDPYTQAPIAWHGGADPITSHVEPPWTTTPSVYGPFATVLQWLTAALGGDHLRQVVWLWQILVVLSWLACRRLLLSLVADRTRVELLWTLNPLVFGLGVLGAHVDVIATALALAVVAAGVRRPLIGGLLLGLAVSTKVTYAVVGLALVLAWATRGGWARTWRPVVLLVAGTLVSAVPLHLALGPHIYDQLGRARRSVSLATPWRPLVEVLTGPLSSATVRNLVFALAALVAIVLAALLAHLTRDLVGPDPVAQALRWTFVLATAYALAAPYSLPWYDLLGWAALAALAPSALDLVLLGRGAVMAVAYVPGRVLGMTPTVERVTLGVRRHVAPYAGLLAWMAIGWLAWVTGRAGRPAPAGSPASPPLASTPPSQ